MNQPCEHIIVVYWPQKINQWRKKTIILIHDSNPLFRNYEENSIKHSLNKSMGNYAIVTNQLLATLIIDYVSLLQ